MSPQREHSGMYRQSSSELIHHNNNPGLWFDLPQLVPQP
jgi:hypothetical protein